MNYTTVKFHTGNLYKLKNDELRFFTQRVFDLLNEAEIEDAYIIDAMNNARRHLDVMNELKDTPLAHDNTKLIQELSLECRDQLISLRTVIDGYKRKAPKGKEEYALTLYLWIRTERKKLATKNRGNQAAVVGRLSEMVSSNPEIAEALEALSLVGHFQEAVSLSDDVIRLLRGRDSDKSSHSMKREEKNVMAITDIDTLLTSVAGRANMNGPSRSYYFALCKELKLYLTSAVAIAKARYTRAENEKNASNGDVDGESESGGNFSVPEADYNNHIPETDPIDDDEV